MTARIFYVALVLLTASFTLMSIHQSINLFVDDNESVLSLSLKDYNKQQLSIRRTGATAIGKSSTDDDESFSTEESTSSSHRRLVWLMSFPNSGTSYTLDTVRALSNTTTAANYEKEWSKPHIINGSNPIPNWLLLPKSGTNNYGEKIGTNTTRTPFPHDSSLALPYTDHQNHNNNAYILTKTHCGGYCSQCGAATYLETSRMFRWRCSQIIKQIKGTDEKGGRKEKSFGHYDPKELVGKAIHLFRDPFDNIVSRFRHDFKHRFTEENREKFPSTVDGFRKWCKSMNDRQRFTYEQEEVLHKRFFDKQLKSFKKRIICFDDFYRYIQWHNLATETTNDLNLPTMIIHYENYNPPLFNDTIKSLLEYLNLDRVNEPEPFTVGKNYKKDYFTKEERMAGREMIRELASRETWRMVKHYLTDEELS